MLDNSFWPSQEAFLDISGVEQLTDGRVRCTALAVCDETGQPTWSFNQGQVAHFFYEFEILSRIGVPGGGVTLRDAADYVIHGKNMFQFGLPALTGTRPGMRLRYHHTIHLELGPGEYFFGVGLASVDSTSYELYLEKRLRHAEFAGRLRTHCHLLKVGSIQVGFDPYGQLTHHGLVNLPGSCNVVLMGRSEQDTSPIHAGPFPALAHLTHPGTGGQWLASVLTTCMPDRIMPMSSPVQPGHIYLDLFADKPRFDQWASSCDVHKFIVIRDLRDTLVWAYTQIKYGQQDEWNKWRARLHGMDTDEGLICLMDEWLPACAEFQLSWAETGARLMRYEELAEFDDMLEQALLEGNDLPVNPAQLQQAIAGSHGQPRSEDVGVWKSYFSPRVAEAFYARYTDVLLNTGYDAALDWSPGQQRVTTPVLKRPGHSLLYVASYPRSGNTWVRNLILHYFDRYVGSFYQENNAPNLEMHEDGTWGSPFYTYQTRHAPLMIRRTLRNRCGRVFSEAFRQYLASAPERFFVKTHELPYPTYLDGETVIYVIRHPGAVFWSYYHFIRDHNLPGAADLTLEDVIRGKVLFGSWSEHVERWLATSQTMGTRFLLWRYEDLAQREAEFCQLMANLSGLPLKGIYGSFPSFDQWKRQAPRLYRDGGHDDWQKHFTPAQIDLIRTLHGPTMSQLGYTFD